MENNIIAGQMATSCYNYELRMRKPKRGNTLPRAQPDSVFKTRYLCTNAVTIPRQRPFRRGLERLAYISTALSGKSGADTQKSAQKHGEQKSRGTNGRICCNYELRMRTPKRGNTWPRAQRRFKTRHLCTDAGFRHWSPHRHLSEEASRLEVIDYEAQKR